ncbi:hypothetical protein CJF25_16090 [Photobacterium phosphoreum]|uniref:hypothetical protein n=1 Tax=Photobacterium phosphoreum TaxID=659 RepID=UPI001E4E3F32|nr:hypothetical protein [Photobacterium phosphoreum]MCD9464486.1 hypothetical protein [Photobacterium phosphoreum]
MAPRENFKIDKNDPDLLMFEQAIANFHPEFYALKQNGQPSYEHPDFCEKVLKFTHLPGCNEPYEILAMNLLNEDDIKHYLHDCLVLLGRPFAQLVKVRQNELKLINRVIEVMDSVMFDGEDGKTSGMLELKKLAGRVLAQWNHLLYNKLIVDDVNNEKVSLTLEDVLNISEVCSDVADILYDSSEDDFLNVHINKSLSTNKKYALLSKVFLNICDELRDVAIQAELDMLANICEIKGCLINKELNINNYIDVILSYELSKYSERIEKEYTEVNMKRNVELLSPSSFLYMRYRFGKKVDDMRRTYRWLFIKAWLYGYLKDKDLSARKVAEIIADDDRFFYLKEHTQKDHPDSDVFSARVKTLTNEFSRWKKHTSKKECETGYLAGVLEDKCHRHYWL